ncbi:hypothetical protein JL722_11221 [Aureococcus anophagefferens]|nr:hypothetical protein JL722_11221 [Aureococcus anophagefferens]
MASLEERVVAWLREEKVKLWLAPYDDDGALTATASTYAAALDEADVAAVAATLRDLRRRAVEKLAAKRRRTVRGAGAAGEPFEVALDGGTAGADARAVLAAAGGYDGRVRVIAGGRALPAAPAVDEPSEVDRLLDACDRLARDRAFDISDGRSGRRVRVPPAARPALVQAVALHARGKRCGDAAAAIDFFLAADEAFDRVRAAAPALVDEVDNFGFLQLDLCRAYALLGDGACLDDAERRLAAAERSWPVASTTATRAAASPRARGPQDPRGVRAPRALQGAPRSRRRAAARTRRRSPRTARACWRRSATTPRPSRRWRRWARRAAALSGAAAPRATRPRPPRRSSTPRTAAARSAEAPIVAGGGATSDGSFVDARALDRLGRECPGVAFEARLAALKRCDNNWSAAAADLRRAAAPVDAAKLAALLELGADRAVAEAALRACDGDAELGGALEDEDADAIDGADLAYETALLESLRS